MATLYKTNGEVIEVFPANSERFTLEEMQGYVGGLIEFINLRTGGSLVVNEEGKVLGLPRNDLASRLPSVVMSLWADDCISGDALLLSEEEDLKQM